MPFDDDDLRRLKYQYCSGHPSERDEVIEALLARLEAAEEYLKKHECNIPAHGLGCELLANWRGLAGK